MCDARKNTRHTSLVGGGDATQVYFGPKAYRRLPSIPFAIPFRGVTRPSCHTYVIADVANLCLFHKRQPPMGRGAQARQVPQLCRFLSCHKVVTTSNELERMDNLNQTFTAGSGLPRCVLRYSFHKIYADKTEVTTKLNAHGPWSSR